MFICIAGKNNIAVDVLEYLIKNNNRRYELGVVCNKTEKGINTWQKSLRYFAKKYKVKEYQIEDIYQINQLLFISLEFDSIINTQYFKDARLYNIHFSLLPKYRGMYTSVFPILNGEKKSGVTLHKINNGIDTGEIISQISFELSYTMTSRELYKKYIFYGTKLMLECIDGLINNKLSSVPQKENESTYYSKKSIDYKNLNIDLCQSAANIDRQIRAFNFREYQLPIVYGKKIIETKITKIKSQGKVGKIIYEDIHGMLISSVDYNIVLFYDRLDELLCACEMGDIKVVQDICIVSNHINARGYNGCSPLMVATHYNKIDIVKYLIMVGANINQKSNNGTNLLMYAKDTYLAYKDITLFKLFWNLGLNETENDYKGHNLLYYIQRLESDVREQLYSIMLKDRRSI